MSKKYELYEVKDGKIVIYKNTNLKIHKYPISPPIFL